MRCCCLALAATSAVLEEYRQRLGSRVGDFDAFVEASGRPLRRSIRLTRRGSKEWLEGHAKERGWTLETVPWDPLCYFVHGDDDDNIGNDVGHVTGRFYMQEAAAASAVGRLGSRAGPGLMIVDACAAPGGKTVQLATDFPDACIVAIEKSSSRLASLAANIERCGVSNVCLAHGDARRILASLPPADIVLLDVPCSGDTQSRRLGISLEKHLTKSDDFDNSMQLELLRAAEEAVRPGGVVCYATCSLDPAENEDIVEQSTLDLVDTKRFWPHLDDTAGFFVARLEKASTEAPTPRESLSMEIERRKHELWLIPSALKGSNLNRPSCKILSAHDRKINTDAALMLAIKRDEFKWTHQYALSRPTIGTKVFLDRDQLREYLRGEDVACLRDDDKSWSSLAGRQVFVSTRDDDGGLVVGLAKVVAATKARSAYLKNQLPRHLVRREVRV